MIFEGNDETTEETTAADEAVADQAANEEAPDVVEPEADAPAEPEAAAEPEPPAEPEEQLGPKERRSRKRSAHTGEARPQRSIEDRTAERLAKRKKNAEERRRYRSKSREKRRASGSGEGTPPAEKTTTGSPRVRQGIVISDKADKTITVRIDVARQHRTYGKIVRSSSKLSAHDERNEANAGDTVRVIESRPLSRSKRWRLVEILERAR
jgi:small subunit ribosomal protein S17